MASIQVTITMQEDVYIAARRKAVNISRICNDAVKRHVSLEGLNLKCDECGLEAPRTAWEKWKFKCPNENCGCKKQHVVGDSDVRDFLEEDVK